MNTAVVNTANASEVKWRKLNDAEKASYGPHSMVVGFAECCPYCREKNLRVVSNSEEPNSPFVYLENHEPHHEDKKGGYDLCPASEAMISLLNKWMSGKDTYDQSPTQVPYAEFVTMRFPATA